MTEDRGCFYVVDRRPDRGHGRLHVQPLFRRLGHPDQRLFEPEHSLVGVFAVATGDEVLVEQEALVERQALVHLAEDPQARAAAASPESSAHDSLRSM